MNITGIITEYNPFHNGHLYHLTESRQHTNADGIICVMSGNFVQRGGPAIVDKWSRTEMALNNGVDLVIELPTFYAVSSAEFFAKGAVSILNSTGIVNNIFFGSECGNVKKLTNIAKILTTSDSNFNSILKSKLNSGLSFAKARELTLIEYLNDPSLEEIISSSNNILGIEYIKALIREDSAIKPFTLKREGSNYNDKEINHKFSSATSIRNFLSSNNNDLSTMINLMPKESYEVLSSLKNSDYNFSFDNDMYNFIKYKIITNSVNYNNLYEIIEGLDKKLVKEIFESTSYEDLILRVKSKRYTYTKISRILTQIFIGFDNFNFELNNITSDNYIRVLGFNATGRDMLSKMKKTSSIPIITKVPKYPNNKLLDLDILATKAYSFLNPLVNAKSDYLKMPIIKY